MTIDEPTSARNTGDDMGVKIAGDWGDDDPLAIDDIAQDVPEPPKAAELPTDARSIPAAKTEPLTRVFGRIARLYFGRAPIMIFPANPNRIRLRFDFMTWGVGLSAALNNNLPYVTFSHDPTVLTSPGFLTAGVSTNGQGLSLDGHTGAVWVNVVATPDYGPFDQTLAAYYVELAISEVTR